MKIVKTMLSTALLAVLLFSCVTTGEGYPPTQNEAMTFDAPGISLSLTLLTEEDLEARHHKGEYFYDYPALIPRKRVVVFEFVGESEGEEISFYVDRIFMRGNERSYAAETLESYKAEWERFLPNENSEEAFDKLTERMMLPDYVLVNEREVDKGYLVFLIQDRKTTDWELVVPAKAKNGDKGNLVFDVTLESLVSDDPTEGNTGIFKSKDEEKDEPSIFESDSN